MQRLRDITKGQKFTVPLAICVVAVGATTAFALKSDPLTSKARGGPTATVPAPVVEHFGAFGQPRTAEDELGSASRGITESRVVPEEGVAIDKSQRAAAPSGTKAWIAPSDDGLCLLVLPEGAIGVGGTCSTAEAAVEGNTLVTMAASPNDVTVYGVVPDEVSSVDLVLRDGSSKTVPVEGNTYGATADQPTVAVEFETQDGRRRVDARSFSG